MAVFAACTEEPETPTETSTDSGTQDSTEPETEAPHEHSWSSDWSSDATNHWHACTGSDCTEVDSKGAHSGGTATCTEKAKCAVCGVPYGDLANHVFDKEVADAKYLKSQADCANGAIYYKSCACGAQGPDTFEVGEPSGNHSFEYENLVIEKVGEGQHKIKCSGCDNYSTVIDCTIAEDDKDCTTGGECICGNELAGESAHAAATEWSKNGTHHWHACTNTGCEGKVDNAAHAGTDDGDCTTAVNCVCGEVAVAAKAHAPSTTWEKDNTNHWHTCTNEGCTKPVDLAAHAWNAGEVTTAPTETVEGEKTYTCTVCSATKKETINATGHSVCTYDVKHELVPEDCTTAGTKEYYTCSSALCTRKFVKNPDESFTEVQDADLVIPATGHTYTWDKSAEDKDVGTCACGDVYEFDKLVEGMTANELVFSESTSNWKAFSLGEADINAKISPYERRNGFSVGGIAVSGDLTGVTYTAIKERTDLHGYQDVILKVIDATGEEHEIKLPMLFVTSTVSTYAEWIANVYPANGDTYGCYKLTTSINFAGSAEPAAPKGAFKGILIGNGIELIGSQGYGRHIFGALDGAYIENLIVRENGYRGSFTRNSLVMGLLGTTMKNSTLNNVTFKLQNSNWASAIDISAGTGWLVGGEVSGNTMTNITVEIKKTVNALAPLFGSNYSNNTISGFTWTVDDGITVPAGEIIVGKNSSSTTYLCDVTNNGNHSFGDTMTYDNVAHWYECSVCGAKKGYAVHTGTPVKVDENNHSITCSCGLPSSNVAHSYTTWDKTAEDKDVGTCDCGATIEFDKKLDGIIRTMTIGQAAYFGTNVLKDTDSVAATYSANLVDWTKSFVCKINGTEIYSGTGFVNITDQAGFKQAVTEAGDYDVIVTVTDIYGETHDLTLVFRVSAAS